MKVWLVLAIDNEAVSFSASDRLRVWRLVSSATAEVGFCRSACPTTLQVTDLE
jgi:hypothetical protein